MLQVGHDGVANENHLGLEFALVVALLSALPVARAINHSRSTLHVEQLRKLVIIHRHAETNHRHQQLTHVFSVGHLNNSRFHGIPLLLNVLTLQIGSQRGDVDGAEFSV